MQAEVGSKLRHPVEPLPRGLARTTLYQCQMDISPDSWTYEQTTTVELARMPGTPFAHTDTNTLHRVAE